MRRKLSGIINVAFDAIGRLLIIYSAFIKYLKNWEYNDPVHQLFIDFKKAYDSVRREVLYKRVEVNQDGLKLNGTHQLLAYADYDNILGGSIHTLKENAEALVAATREIELELSADKTKYMVMSRDKNAG